MVVQVPYFMQVPRLEVIERVSSILKDNGFCPTSEWTEIGNLYVLVKDYVLYTYTTDMIFI